MEGRIHINLESVNEKGRIIVTDFPESVIHQITRDFEGKNTFNFL